MEDDSPPVNLLLAHFKRVIKFPAALRARLVVFSSRRGRPTATESHLKIPFFVDSLNFFYALGIGKVYRTV